MSNSTKSLLVRVVVSHIPSNSNICDYQQVVENNIGAVIATRDKVYDALIATLDEQEDFLYAVNERGNYGDAKAEFDGLMALDFSLLNTSLGIWGSVNKIIGDYSFTVMVLHIDTIKANDIFIPQNSVSQKVCMIADTGEQYIVTSRALDTVPVVDFSSIE